MPKSPELPSKPLPFSNQHRQQPYPFAQPSTNPPYCQPPLFDRTQQPYPPPLSSNNQPTPQNRQALLSNQHTYQHPPHPPLPRIETNLTTPTSLSEKTLFPAPPTFTFRCPNPRYPRYTLSSLEISQTIPEFIADLLAKDRAKERGNATRSTSVGQSHGASSDGVLDEPTDCDNDDYGNTMGWVGEGREDGVVAVIELLGGGGVCGGNSSGATGGELNNGNSLGDAESRHQSQDGRVKKPRGTGDRKRTISGPSRGGRENIPGTGEFQVILTCTPKKDDIKDHRGNKEPRATSKFEVNEGNSDKEPIDSPFEDNEHHRDDIPHPETPTTSYTENGSSPRQISSDPWEGTQAWTKGKKPKPPKPWLPPIKESEITHINGVELKPEQQFKQDLEPVAELNTKTPWNLPFQEQSLPQPTWHNDCPDGYEPTALVGFPQTSSKPLWLSVAHDLEQELTSHGHWCIDKNDVWDRCVMGKCEGCLVCRPDAF